MADYKQTKKVLAELVAMRDRTGKDPLPVEERVQLLNEIYDGLLYLWKQAVIAGHSKGTWSMSGQLERARLEIEALTKTKVSARDFEGIDFSLPEFDETLTNN